MHFNLHWFLYCLGVADVPVPACLQWSLCATRCSHLSEAGVIGVTRVQEFKPWKTSMIRYSFSELLSLDHHLPPSECTQNALRAHQLLRRPSYIHCGSRRGLYLSSTGINVLCSHSLGSGHINSCGICMSNLTYPQMSLPNKRDKSETFKIRLAQLNVGSMN